MQTHRISRLSRWLVVACTLGAGLVGAQTRNDIQAVALQWLDTAVADMGAQSGAALKMEVSVGELDARLKLAPCGAMEAYTPLGARLWGRTRVGVRCTDGMARWNVTLPATVRALGTAWVVKNPISVGQEIADSDMRAAEVDWAAESDPIVVQREQWVGQVATRSMTAGQALRRSMVKPAQVFQAGAPVRVVAQGQGFQVSSDAQALGVGVVGQSVRVRMENGRISSGLVLDGHTVRIDL